MLAVTATLSLVVFTGLAGTISNSSDIQPAVGYRFVQDTINAQELQPTYNPQGTVTGKSLQPTITVYDLQGGSLE